MTLGSGVILDLYGGVSGSTTWADHSIHGNDGVLDSADMRVQAPNDLEVMEFNGSRKASCGSFAFAESFTLLFWGNLKEALALPTLIANCNSGGTQDGFKFNLYRSGATHKMFFECGDGGAGEAFDTTTTVFGSWMLFGVTIVKGGTSTFYKNGVAIDTFVTTKDFSIASQVVHIGDMTNGYVDSFLDGQLWRPRAFTYVLSEPEIGEIHEQEELWFR